MTTPETVARSLERLRAAADRAVERRARGRIRTIWALAILLLVAIPIALMRLTSVAWFMTVASLLTHPLGAVPGDARATRVLDEVTAVDVAGWATVPTADHTMLALTLDVFRNAPPEVSYRVVPRWSSAPDGIVTTHVTRPHEDDGWWEGTAEDWTLTSPQGLRLFASTETCTSRGAEAVVIDTFCRLTATIELGDAGSALPESILLIDATGVVADVALDRSTLRWDVCSLGSCSDLRSGAEPE